MNGAAWGALTGVPGGLESLLGSMEERQFHPESPQWDWGPLIWQKQNKDGAMGLNSAGLE